VSTIRVSLASENPAYAGVVSFDGGVVEALGFADLTSQRMPIEVVDEVVLEDSMFNVFSNPEKGDSYGIQLPIKPSSDETIALQGLADAIESAIDGAGSG
jgi:hypothetical protein